jgi:hypothetical protein
MGYSTRRQESDLYLPGVKKIVGDYFNFPADQIRTSTFFEDVRKATDLVTPDQKKIAVRVRGAKYRGPYYGQFTVRTSSGADGLTELAKLQSGKADYIFYAFTADDGETLTEWWLMGVNCLTFRYPIGDRTNGYDSCFRAFDINSGVVVSSSLPYPFGVCNN